MPTTNEPKYFGGYEADDHNGHTGTGDTPEQAQQALEEAQRTGARSAVYEPITGVIVTYGSDTD